MIATWPCPAPGGTTAPEYAVTLDRARTARVLIVPALFDEANRLRRFTVETMRRLDAAGIDSVLPDLPGCNESLQPLGLMTLDHWHSAMAAAAAHFGATHVLAIRGGALVAPALPGQNAGWCYAPVSGASILRQMIRIRTLASREAGREENAGTLLEQGQAEGLVLAGYSLSAAMVTGLQGASPPDGMAVIAQSAIGGAGLWLRAEPDEAPEQSAALADLLARALQC